MGDKARTDGKVEGFKLTKEWKVWHKQYKRVNEVTQMIANGLRLEYGKVAKLRAAFDEANGQRQQLLKLAPTDLVNELDGQSPVGGQGQGPRPEQQGNTLEGGLGQ